jgi:hypothetical protein
MGVKDQQPGLSDRAKLVAAVLIGGLYAIGMTIRAIIAEGPASASAVLAGLVGGVLAGILCFLVLRAVERQRRERRRRR